MRRARELANEGRREELKAVIDALGKSVGARVAEQIGRMFRA